MVPLPGPAPARLASPALHVVLTPEGLAPLDETVRQATVAAARQLGASADVQELATFLTAADGSADRLAHRLLATVQAGVAPDAILLSGRQAQTARLRAMDLVQDVSGLMRTTRQRYGNVPPVTEVWHVVAGNWFAVPYYQRLIGHWLRADLVPELALDRGAEVTFEQLAPALASSSAAAAGNSALAGISGGDRPAPGMAGAYWPWGIGAADTGDVDAWCWNVIHAFGGALADRKGERVQLAGAETAAALDWLRQSFTALGARGRLPPSASQWLDEEKNAAFLAGSTAYTFTDDLPGLPGADAPLPTYLPGPAGPVNRPRATGGGAAWYVPRGAPAPVVEQLLERLLALPAQQALWKSSGSYALPAFEQGWNDAQAGDPPARINVTRFRQELTNGGFASATGNAGPETAASQAVAEGRLAAAMLRAALAGRPVADVLAEAQQSAAGVFRDFGLPG